MPPPRGAREMPGVAASCQGWGLKGVKGLKGGCHVWSPISIINQPSVNIILVRTHQPLSSWLSARFAVSGFLRVDVYSQTC